MKKIVFFTAAMLMSLTTFAQIKGERYISGAISANFGTQETILMDGLYSDATVEPQNSSFGLGAEYGYFAADNLRFALALSVSYTASPITEMNTGWLKNKTLSFGVNPNISYYVPITDRLYFTPEIGILFEFGSLKEELSSHETYTVPARSCNLYVNLLALEFRVSERSALGVVAGGISYNSVFCDYDEIDTDFMLKQFTFGFNDALIYYRYYF